jgi:hypothetical protein
MFPRMRWIDTTNGVLKRRNAANSAWIVIDTDEETRVVTRSSNTMLDLGDYGKTFLLNGTFTQTLDQASILGDGWWCRVRNDGNGIVTIDPAGDELLDGAMTLPLQSGQSGTIVCNGSTFRTIGRSGAFRDDDPLVQAAGDPTKKLRFEIDGFTSGATRVVTVQNADQTMVGESVSQTLTNKTINADSNTITNIDQGNLKTTTGEVTQSGVTGWTLLTLPGGEWGFYPQFKTGATTNPAHHITCSILPVIAFAGDTGALVEQLLHTNYLTRISLWQDSGVDTSTCLQRYVQASPPYDLGDGEVPLFLFALVDSLGKIVATYTAEDPPWANNGPTDIRPTFRLNGKGWKVRRPKPNLAALGNPAQRQAELIRLAARRIAPPDAGKLARNDPLEVARLKSAGFEIVEVTQAIKNADMPLIPHPFLGNDMTGKTVVLLDPMSSIVERMLDIVASGERVSEILHGGAHGGGGYLAIDNVPLARGAPPGVMPVDVKWKVT